MNPEVQDPPADTPALTRRHLLAAGVGAAATLATGAGASLPPPPLVSGPALPCSTVPEVPTAERPDPQANWRVFSAPETALAFRNHGMQAELLRHSITPLGAHYLLIHFDIPRLDASGYSVALGGHVLHPRRITLDELQGRPRVTQAVTLECAGTGRSTARPRGVYVPWFKEDIGTYRWTGTPLRPLLEEAGVLGGAAEVLFTGWDTGVDLGVEHAFERSLPLAEALRDEVMLAWEANGQPLLPQHGFPLRLIVPSWYGMASVKWLRAITVLKEPFEGVQQAQVYRYQRKKGERGEPVTLKRVHCVMQPPGLPDLLSRQRFLAPGRHTLEGMAWSGAGGIQRVEVSTDGGETWRDAELERLFEDRFAWTRWRLDWQVQEPGEYVLMCRATDEAGERQPLSPQARWNRQGMGINAVQSVRVTVQPGVGLAGTRVPSPPRLAVEGAKLPPVPTACNPLAEGEGA